MVEQAGIGSMPARLVLGAESFGIALQLVDQHPDAAGAIVTDPTVHGLAAQPLTLGPFGAPSTYMTA
jgi:hypothetical protein